MLSTYVLGFILLCISAVVHSSESLVDLEFVVPGSQQALMTATLSIQSSEGVSFSNLVRAVLHIDSIIMDCSFTFDTQPTNGLICDVNTACIWDAPIPLRDIKIHFENLGVIDVHIVQLKHLQSVVFYDSSFCIGDSSACDHGRFVDFVYDPSTFHLQRPLERAISQPKMDCNPQSKVYHIQTQYDYKNTQYSGNEASSHIMHKNRRSRRRRRQLLSVYNDIYGDRDYARAFEIVPQQYYMDIALITTFFILVLLSLFNMSYALNYYKSVELEWQPHYLDTRRV